MNNSILSKMAQGIPQQFYGGPSSSFKIRGTLVEKNGDTIKIDIGGERILEAEMKGKVNGEVGETIVIDKKDILKSKIYQVKEEPQEIGQPNEEENILRQWKLPVNEETKGALKALEKHGVEITKENIQYFIASKRSLEKVIAGLDYETAIKLMEKNIDIEEESLQKVADMLEEIRGEKEGFSLLRLFTRKKAMTSEEAEKKGIELYNNKMGKDITDVIKALHKAGLEITKSNIEKVNIIFNKLDNLQDIKEATIIDALKNEIEASIDYLYKLKNTITKSVIAAEERISQLASRAYDSMTYQANVVTTKDLEAMEGNINSLLSDEGMEVTQKVVDIAKELIRNGLEVSRENIEKVQGVKVAIRELKHLLNYERTAQMLKAGLQVEKKNVVALVKDIKENMVKETMIKETMVKEPIVKKPMTEEVMGLQRKEPQGNEKLQFQHLRNLYSMKGFVENIRSIDSYKETILSLLIKNAVPIDLKQLNGMELFLNNKQQIAAETSNILNILEKSGKKELKDLERKIKGFLKEVTDNIKTGRLDPEKTYQQLEKMIKEVGDKVHLLGETEREAFQKSSENLRDSINLQNQLNKEDVVLQLPIMMDNQLKNLQIYIMNKKKSSKKINPNDMSILLNFDTNNMGNINIYTSVSYKKVFMKVGVKNQRDKKLFEDSQHVIEELLMELGYELKEMTFKVEEEQHLLTMAENSVEGHRAIKSILDIRI